MRFDAAALALRDIHLPPAPPPWPPPALVWLAAALLFGAVAVVWYWRRYRRQAAMRVALAELAEISARRQAHPDDSRWLADLSILLRRVALGRYPRHRVAGLQGEAWLDFLVEAGAGEVLRGEPGRWLLQGPYQPRLAMPGEDAEVLLGAVRRWLQAPVRHRGTAPC